jgi:4-carboxymuconolactone decarboxylase
MSTAAPDYFPDALRRGGELFGEEFSRKLFAELSEWDEQFSDLFQRFVYGGMYDREVLDQRTRELAAVAACVTANALPQLRSHAMASVRAGATVREIQEIVMQMTVYCGWPFVLQAIRHVNSFMTELRALELEYAELREELSSK